MADKLTDASLLIGNRGGKGWEAWALLKFTSAVFSKGTHCSREVIVFGDVFETHLRIRPVDPTVLAFGSED